MCPQQRLQADLPRIAHKPTDDTRKSVKAMAAYGIPHLDISTAVGITTKTLRKHYRAELDVGHINANAQVVGSLFKLAIGGNVTAAIFWTKARMGWSDRGIAPGDDETAEERAKAIHTQLAVMDERSGGAI